MPANVVEFLATIENDGRREDCYELTELMRAVTGEEPKLWGSMIGFGSYHFRYASGREGDYFKVGFSPRKSDLTIYLMSGLVGYDELLARVNPHTTAKSAIYLKRLDDVDKEALAELIRESVAHLDQVEAERGAIPRMSEMPPRKQSSGS